MAIHLHGGRKKNGSSRMKVKPARSSLGKPSEKRTKSAKPGRSPQTSKQKSLPQKVLLHAARTVPTPDIFNEVPEQMPFSTDKE